MCTLLQLRSFIDHKALRYQHRGISAQSKRTYEKGIDLQSYADKGNMLSCFYAVCLHTAHLLTGTLRSLTDVLNSKVHTNPRAFSSCCVKCKLAWTFMEMNFLNLGVRNFFDLIWALIQRLTIETSKKFHSTNTSTLTSAIIQRVCGVNSQLGFATNI